MTVRAHRIRLRSPGSCANCLHVGPDVTFVIAQVHGVTALCAGCREYADSRGWLAAESLTVSGNA
jgi:hypothetical protein